MIEIRLTRTEVEAGGRVAGTVTWLPDQDYSPRSIKVSAAWRTEGRGDVDRDTADETSISPGSAGPASPVHLPFDLAIPADGPLSYDGRLIRVIWEVRTQVDLPLRKDLTEAAPFRVVPRSARA